MVSERYRRAKERRESALGDGHLNLEVGMKFFAGLLVLASLGGIFEVALEGNWGDVALWCWAVVGAVSLFVPFFRLPWFAARLERPGRSLPVLSKLFGTVAFFAIPYLVVEELWLLTAAAVLVLVGSVGLWFHSRWALLPWYVCWLVLASASVWGLVRSLRREGPMVLVGLAELLAPLVFISLFIVDIHRWLRLREETPGG
jgi:hypothetical protein